MTTANTLTLTVKLHYCPTLGHLSLPDVLACVVTCAVQDTYLADLGLITPPPPPRTGVSTCSAKGQVERFGGAPSSRARSSLPPQAVLCAYAHLQQVCTARRLPPHGCSVSILLF